MKRSNLAFFIFIVLSHLNCYSQDNKFEFNWLVGNWEAKIVNGKVYEYWKKVDNATFEAIGGQVLLWDTVFKESISLKLLKGKTCYSAKVGKQKKVLFFLKSMKDDIYVFENKKHDFPQRIIYEYLDSLNMKTTAEGMVKGQYVREEYWMSKVKQK